MSYDNTNRGTIAKNTRKTEDSHPDIAGQINVNGVDFWLNGWAKKNSKDGSSFYSLTVKPKQERAQEIRREAERRQPDDGAAFDRAMRVDFDDEVPFAPEFR